MTKANHPEPIKTQAKYSIVFTEHPESKIRQAKLSEGAEAPLHLAKQCAPRTDTQALSELLHQRANTF